MEKERIWFQNVKELFRYPSRFWPTKDMSPGGQINALVRFIVYASFAAYAYNRDVKTFYFGLLLITLVSLAYNGKPGGRLATLSPVKCKKPTRHNPFMNTLLNEYGKDPVPPCDYETVKEEVREKFNTGLYRNIEDLYERENSQREFITMPNGGLPPDSREFAEFLYGNVKNCKQFPGDCNGGL